jgi:hypothetical protein
VAEIWEDEPYYFDLDPSIEGVTWSLPIAPDWLIIDPVTGELSGTPLNGDVGTSNVWAMIEDGTGNSDILSFEITVKNQPPAITTDDPRDWATEDHLYNFTFHCDDDGQGDITWALLEGPDWLSMNATTGFLSGMPENEDVGKHLIRVSVDDGNGGVGEFSFLMTVWDENDPPHHHFGHLPNGTVGEYYWYMLVANDHDLTVDYLIYSMTTNASWLSIDDMTGIIYGTPDEPGEYWVNATVTDGGGLYTWKNLSLMVLPGEEPPVPFDETTDSDGDGMPDAWEVYYGLDKDNASDAMIDSEGDGILNIDEYKNGSSPIRFDPKPLFDSDGDGMKDLWEDQYYLNKFDSNDALVDTDGDGFLNLWEYQNLTNPLDPLSHPTIPPDDDDDDEKDLELTYIIAACVIFLGLVIFGIFFLAASSKKKGKYEPGWEE